MPLKIDNVAPLPAVTRDNPTKQAVEKPRPRRGAQTPRKATETAPLSLDQALASQQRPVTNRVASELWSQLIARADDMNVPIRLVLTDAIVQALEQPTDEHAAAVRKTRRREQLAKIEPED